MLKSCIRPCEVLIRDRYTLVISSITFRHVIVPTQSWQQLRPKSSSTRSPSSRRGNKQRTPEGTQPPSFSKLNSTAPETRKEVPQKSEHFKSNPEPSSPAYSFPTVTHVDGLKFRPLIINPVKPTPNQDLKSTRPAELEATLPPEQDQDGNVAIAARAGYFYRLGKSYLTFYKTGLKSIWNNRKEYNKIKARLGSYTPEDAALYGGQQVSNERAPERIPTITRREYQLCLRTKHDIGKLIPFGMVFAICGEFTPLVILALGSSVVPYTCRIPKQVQHDRRWFVKRLQENAEDRLERLQNAEGENFMNPQHGTALAFLHGVSPIAEPPPIIGKLFYHFWVRPRLIRRGREILADTILIRREGGFDKLEPIEVWEYANKFFCPHVIWACKRELEISGEISWNPDTASTIGSILERHATIMLAHDWEHIPEQLRFQSGLSFNGTALSTVEELEKEHERTGRLPF